MTKFIDNNLTIDNTYLSNVKYELNKALVLAVTKAKKDSKVKITLTINLEQGDNYLLDGKTYLWDDEKYIDEINFTCKVTSTEEISNEKDSVSPLIVGEKNGRMVARDPDDQLSIWSEEDD